MMRRQSGSRDGENRRGSLTDHAYAMLRAAILRGEFEEGSFLTEALAQRRFDIGHTPFREACNRLLNEGFVDLMPRRGYFLPQVTVRRVRDLLEARICVEGQVVAIAAKRATHQQLQEMNTLLSKRMPTKLNASTVTQIVEANARFHISIAEMTQNHELVEMVRRLLDRSSRFVYLLKADRSLFEVHAIHRGIAKAIRDGDVSKARQLIIADIRAGQSEFFA